jgi:hypothetical protein
MMDKASYDRNFKAIWERYPSAKCDTRDHLSIILKDYPGKGLISDYRTDLVSNMPGITETPYPNRFYCDGQCFLSIDDEDAEETGFAGIVSLDEVEDIRLQFEMAGRDATRFQEIADEYEEILAEVDAASLDRVYVTWFEKLETFLPKYMTIYDEEPPVVDDEDEIA